LGPINTHRFTSLVKERAKYSAENPDKAALNAENSSTGAIKAAANQATAISEKNCAKSSSYRELNFIKKDFSSHAVLESSSQSPAAQLQL
jgi:hypothetical protein